MVSLRRFGLLLVAFSLALSVVIARLYDVQVSENPIWAREAANLMRSWRVEPYLRGSITDREGRVWVRDEEVYELELVWRDFRRGHPLGQVAQARSLIELRSVPLEDVHSDLLGTVIDLVRLSPEEIDAFGNGAGLRVGASAVAPVDGATGRERTRNARAERRGLRATELHWYVRSLLSPSRREQRVLRDAKGTESWGEPYVTLIARERGAPASSVELALQGHLSASLVRLAELASVVDAGELLPGHAPFQRLLGVLEAKRKEVEFAAADDLFGEAAGFSAQRLDASNLACIDLDWLRRALYWDHTRLKRWIEERGNAWPQAVDEALAGHVIARAKVAREWEHPADQVLSALASSFANGPGTLRGSALPVPWWRQDEVVVLADFEERFERTETIPAVLFGADLPFQDPTLRSEHASFQSSDLLEHVLRGTPGLPEAPPRLSGVTPEAYAARVLSRAAEQAHPTWHEHQETPVRRVLKYWDSLLQARIRTLFEYLPGGVSLRDARVNEALETRPYVIRDRESRPLRFSRSPGYDLVHLVTRHPDHYAGFHVRSATRRVPVAVVDSSSERPIMVAETLIGRTRSPYLVRILEQRPEQARMRNEQRKLEIDDETREWILETAKDIYALGAATGNGGLEEHWDDELSGKNGYREFLGLHEREEGRSPVHVPAVDGRSLTLTLDLELQRAWEDVLERPAPPPPGEDKPDRAWHVSPVGAAVLMTVEGEVLVAASTPRIPDEVDASTPPRFFQDGQRAFALDRTLRMITFQPPGSVVKPLVAAWALEQGKITPGTPFECRYQEGDPVRFGSHKPYRPGSGRVHCLSTWGHGGLADGGVELDQALRHSCNAYFAALGEWIDKQGFTDLCHTFGLDTPTGVRLTGRSEGLSEDSRASRALHDETTFTPLLRQRFANGLSHLNATPMQMARAYAALATGRLPDVRLVKAVGGTPIPPSATSIPISSGHLDTVRGSLQAVVVSGTARGKGLSEGDLGYRLACKTGSADYNTTTRSVPVDPLLPPSNNPKDWEKGDRKHAWLAGYFPAEDPRFVLVVYCHDTTTTSSHIATHIARQLLTHPVASTWIELELGL